MAKKKSGYTPEQSHMIIFGVILAILAVILFVYERNTPEQPKNPVTAITPTLSPEGGLLADVAVWYPSAPWSTPKPTSTTTMYGDLKGEIMNAIVTSDTAAPAHFEQVNALSQMGFQLDNNLAADGPGASVWGYKKTTSGMMQVMIFSYKTQPTSTNPNEPLQFNCPCKVNMSVFVSNPTPAK